MTNAELKALKKRYPEGIPQWMMTKGFNKVIELMDLRRKTFPLTNEGK